MNRNEQTARLARALASRLPGSVTEYEFYKQVLGRRDVWPGGSVSLEDTTLWRQAQYAMENFTPEQLERMADELLAATERGGA